MKPSFDLDLKKEDSPKSKVVEIGTHPVSNLDDVI